MLMMPPSLWRGNHDGIGNALMFAAVGMESEEWPRQFKSS